MRSKEDTMNRIQRGAWAVLGATALAGAIFWGAWWHLFSAAFCWLLWFESGEPATRDGERRD